MPVGRIVSVIGTFGFAAFVSSLGSVIVARGVSGLGRVLFGGRARAVVVGTETERDPDAMPQHWTFVRFSTADGQVHDQVRLCSWSSLPPRTGSTVRVYYSRRDPRRADRARILVNLVRIVAGPAVVVFAAALVAVVVFGWDPQP